MNRRLSSIIIIDGHMYVHIHLPPFLQSHSLEFCRLLLSQQPAEESRPERERTRIDRNLRKCNSFLEVPKPQHLHRPYLLACSSMHRQKGSAVAREWS